MDNRSKRSCISTKRLSGNSFKVTVLSGNILFNTPMFWFKKVSLSWTFGKKPKKVLRLFPVRSLIIGSILIVTRSHKKIANKKITYLGAQMSTIDHQFTRAQ